MIVTERCGRRSTRGRSNRPRLFYAGRYATTRAKLARLPRPQAARARLGGGADAAGRARWSSGWRRSAMSTTAPSPPPAPPRSAGAAMASGGSARRCAPPGSARRTAPRRGEAARGRRLGGGAALRRAAQDRPVRRRRGRPAGPRKGACGDAARRPSARPRAADRRRPTGRNPGCGHVLNSTWFTNAETMVASTV